MGILDDFYNGNIFPMELVPGSHKECRKYVNEKEKYIKELQLTNEQTALLEKIFETQVYLNEISCRNSFVTGWKLGVKFILDTLHD